MHQQLASKPNPDERLKQELANLTHLNKNLISWIVIQLVNQLEVVSGSTKFAAKFDCEVICELPIHEAKAKLVEMFFLLSELFFENKNGQDVDK